MAFRQPPNPMPRHRFHFASCQDLAETTGRLMGDPFVESCDVDVPNLVVEVGLTNTVVCRERDAGDWLRRFRRSARGLCGVDPFGGATGAPLGAVVPATPEPDENE